MYVWGSLVKIFIERIFYLDSKIGVVGLLRDSWLSLDERFWLDSR